jgi:hypothetical protein
MFDELGLAVKEAAALDVDALTDGELDDAVVELARHRAALEAAEARVGGAWDGRGV